MSTDNYVDYLKKLDCFHNLEPGEISAEKLKSWNMIQKTLLPIGAFQKNLIYKNQFVIIVGETGSGKTTQIPQFLVYDKLPHLNGKMIGCTQPRRVATTSIARRVAEELDVDLGSEVGHSIRFEDLTSSKTFLKYMTGGTLFREAMYDPLLTRYSAIVLDEIHERSLNVDILMGLLKKFCKERKDLTVVIMSATLDAGKFQKYFDNAPILNILGRTFPVDISYTPTPTLDYLTEAVRTIFRIHDNEPEGDILVFLTGEKEIEDAVDMIEEEYSKYSYLETGPLRALPLYASLPPYEQQQVFEKAPPPHIPGGKPGRKVIISTNIAQTSVTIDGIVYVVDSGFIKQSVYNPRTRVDTLKVISISKAAAKQRSGRAGRTRPGKAFRLYTEKSYESQLPEQSLPEILTSNLGNSVLQLLKFGIVDILNFDFMDPPSPELFVDALSLLQSLQACDGKNRITPTGDLMSFFPLDPPIYKMLIESPKYGCSEEILTLAALLSVPQIFYRPYKKQQEADLAKRQFESPYGDHLTLLNVYEAYKENLDDPQWCRQNFVNHTSLKLASDIKVQLRRSMEAQGIPILQDDDSSEEYYVKIRKAICEGFFVQVASLLSRGNYQIVKDSQMVRIHPSSVLFKNKPKLVIYHEIIMSSKKYSKTCTPVKLPWLRDIGHDFRLQYEIADIFGRFRR